MKIAFLSVFHPFRGGIAQSNAQLYRAFERQGHEVRAWNFTTQYPDLLFPGTSQYVKDGDQADEIPNERILSSINPLTFLKAIKRIRAYEPDLLVLRYWMPFFAPSLGYVAGKLRRSETKVVAVIDNLIPHEKRPGDEWLTRYFLGRCDGFVVMSDVVQNDLCSYLPTANFNFHPHPLYDQFGAKRPKLEAQQELGISPDQKVILYFGLIRQYKGLDILIEAFGTLTEDYELLIVGEPYEDFSSYQALIDQNPNNARIHTVTRYVSDDEVPLYFSAADVCVLPYRTATQSGVVAIAYHFELPVIVTDVGGLRGSVEPFGAGLVVDQAQPMAFAQAIRAYFSNNQASTMAKAIQDFKTKYTWDSMVTKIIQQFC